MATTVQYTQHFAASPEEVWQMLTDPEYITTKGMSSGSLEVNPEVATRSDDTLVISRRRLPAMRFRWAPRSVRARLGLRHRAASRAAP